MSDDWIAVASLSAAVVAACGVIGQVAIQRGQRRLEEAGTYRQQADAWANLADEWPLAVLAAVGPLFASRYGISEATTHEYDLAVERYRVSRVVQTDALSRASAGATEIAEANDEVRAAEEALTVYRLAAQRIVTHLAGVAGLILRGRLSIDAVYDAMGPQILRVGDNIKNLLKMAYGQTSTCPAPVMMEGAAWEQMTVDELTGRLGWGDFLDVARGTAERIALLIDLFVAHGVRVGDLHAIPNPGIDHRAISLTDIDRLASAYRAARPFGRLKAMSVAGKLASAGKFVRRRTGMYYPRWAARAWSGRVASRPLPYSGWLRRPLDDAGSVVDVVRAAFRSKRADDIRLIETAPHRFADAAD